MTVDDRRIMPVRATTRPMPIDHGLRQMHIGSSGPTVWLTGLSGSGKSTIGSAVERVLGSRGIPAYLLDGDVLRCGLNKDLGFSPADRRENVRRIAEVACLLADSGVVAIVAVISPYTADRALARAAHDDAGISFVEVFVDAPLAVCEARDPKGLYVRARAGRLASFTGVGAVYEPPSQPDVHLPTDVLDVAGCVHTLLAHVGHQPAASAPPRAVAADR